MVVRVDDVLVSGGDDEDPLRNLEEVLRGLAKERLLLKKGKCFFMESQVTSDLSVSESKQRRYSTRLNQSPKHHLQRMCQSSSPIWA